MCINKYDIAGADPRGPWGHDPQKPLKYDFTTSKGLTSSVLYVALLSIPPLNNNFDLPAILNIARAQKNKPPGEPPTKNKTPL